MQESFSIFGDSAIEEIISVIAIQYTTCQCDYTSTLCDKCSVQSVLKDNQNHQITMA